LSAQQLELAAELLGPLLDEVVFVGGATVHLWLTEPDAPPARTTEDIDVICEFASRAAYYRLGGKLRERGLQEAADTRPCRHGRGWHGFAHLLRRCSNPGLTAPQFHVTVE
jgi:hypothetical protein